MIFFFKNVRYGLSWPNGTEMDAARENVDR